MGLVTAKEVSSAIKLDKYGFLGTFVGWLLMKVLKISTLNKIYDRNKHLKDLNFLDSILDEFQIKFEIPEEDLKRLPKDGAYITVSNHPLGGIDGILLLKLMLEQLETSDWSQLHIRELKKHLLNQNRLQLKTYMAVSERLQRCLAKIVLLVSVTLFKKC